MMDLKGLAEVLLALATVAEKAPRALAMSCHAAVDIVQSLDRHQETAGSRVKQKEEDELAKAWAAEVAKRRIKGESRDRSRELSKLRKRASCPHCKRCHLHRVPVARAPERGESGQVK